MFLVNYLNRSATDAYRPLFQCIYAMELLFIIISLFCAYPLIVAVYSAKSYHRNLRLHLVALLLQIVICSLARTVVIYHQAYGPIQHIEPVYLILASLIREAFKGYAVSLYESQQPSTIIAYVALECVQLCMSWMVSILLISATINDQEFSIFWGMVLVIGVVCYYSVSRYTRMEIERFKKGAQIQSYSVSKCFQYRENVAIIKVLNLIAGPVALSALPCFVFYAVYLKVPSDIGLDLLRYIAIALYDLWIAEGILVFMLIMLKSEPKFRENAKQFLFVNIIMGRFGPTVNDESITKIAPQDPNLYFAMLSRDLE